MSDIYRTTGSAAMTAANASYTKTEIGPELVEVRLHLSAAAVAAENFVIYIDSINGTAYDVILFTQAMATVQDVIYRPDTPIRLLSTGDKFVFTYTNTNARTWGLECRLEK